jgi:Domain of unknown function (DUF4249)
MKPTILLIISLFVLTSCDTLVEFVDPSALPEYQKKLVVHSFIQPQDTVISVKATYTTPIFYERIEPPFTNTPQPVELAPDLGFVVTMADDTQTIALTFNPKTGNYEWRNQRGSGRFFSVVGGRTYTLRVSDSEGRVAQASCVVPQAAPTPSITVDSIPNRNDPRRNDAQVRLSWLDLLGLGNRYLAVGAYYTTITVTNPMQPPRTDQNIQSLSFNSNGSSGYFSDENRDGAIMVTSPVRIESNWLLPDTPALKRRIEFYLLSLDKDYYEYLRAVQRFDGDNPFTEPTLLPTNINGGLGYFAGYNRTTVRLR